MNEQLMMKLQIEHTALRTLRFCRKHKKNYHEWGYPRQFVRLIEDLEAVCPEKMPLDWKLQRGGTDHSILGDPTLVDRAIDYFNGLSDK